MATPTALQSVSIALLGGVASCREAGPPVGSGQGGAAAAADPARGAVQEEVARQTRETVDRALNPKGLPVYAGPVGTVRGRVKVTGDPPPVMPDVIAKLPTEGCSRASELYRKLYRQGDERTLADVLVTVTEYQGFVPSKSEAVRIDIKGCAFDSRVVALTFGQRLEVFNLDNQSYMPRLVGTPTYALRVAMPGGGPVPLLAPRPGPYLLADQTREYLRADVFVLNYPTADVTGLDGRFEITGVPIGEAKLTAFASAFGKVVEQKVTIVEGAGVDIELEIPFSEADYKSRASGPVKTEQR